MFLILKGTWGNTQFRQSGNAEKDKQDYSLVEKVG